MLRNALHLLRHYLVALIALCILGASSFVATSQPTLAAAHIRAQVPRQAAVCQSQPQPEPDNNSLLVVVLDRSGSLVDTPTDPDLYSVSVTRALADLWPGKMAVVAFNTSKASGSEQVQLIDLGPLQVGDNQEANRNDLKNKILSLPRPSLGTPTGPAMDRALEIVQQTHAPLAKAVLITDGKPGYLSNNDDGSAAKQEDHIRNVLLSQFCAAAVPVDTIGLKTDDEANSLLSDIATGTGGRYQSVQDPGDLAHAVFTLYGQWQQNRVDFQPLQLQSDLTYHITVGDLARNINFFVFRSHNTVVVKDPSGQSLPVVETSNDQHYVYDTLDLSPPRPSGDYTIDVGGDPQAQVYAFVASNLQVHITVPTSTTTLAVDQPVSIQAALYDGQKPIASLAGDAALVAYVLFTSPDQKTVTEQVNLQQQKDLNLFTGKTTATYPQTGALHILVIANYAGLRAEFDLTTGIVCGSSVPCLIQQYLLFLFSALLLFALLVAVFIVWLLWKRQPAPFGTLRTPPPLRTRRTKFDEDDDDEAMLPLANVEASLPLQQRIFHRSILTSDIIKNHRDAKGNFDFDLATFDLVFKKDTIAEIRSTAMEPITIKRADDQKETLSHGESAQLHNGDTICIDNKDRAIFSNL